MDAIIYGRDLGTEGDDYVSEERFEKIKYYLKHGKYPNGADRAEKSRLRSAATHYKLLPETETEPERLMLKDKEVISDPQKQYELARQIHLQHHGGINKTTASIAEKYHWVRIKETVSQVIRNCPDCKDAAKTVTTRSEKKSDSPSHAAPATADEALMSTPSGPSDTTMAEAQLMSAAQTQLMNDTQNSTGPTVGNEQIIGYSVPVDPQIVTNVNFQHQQAAPTAVMTSMGLPTHDPNAAHVAGQQSEEDFDFSKQLYAAGFEGTGYDG